MKTGTPPAAASERAWVLAAVRRIEADFQRSSDTHLIPLPLAGFPGVDLYLKDESSHPTGSLKHRLARSLFLYALCNGWLHQGTTVVEASSGSTAISEAYFARLLALPFVAVMPAATSSEKIAAIEFQGGRCHLVDDPLTIYSESRRLADQLGGHYLDQFTYAERATDWRSNNNIAESIFQQMRLERYPLPEWIVSSAGTGGTVATLGRYVRYCARSTRICAADPENSVFFDHYRSRQPDLCLHSSSRIEGIGRPRVEASFLPKVIDAMVRVPDVWSLAAMHELTARLGRSVGASTGTNLIAALACMARMQEGGVQGSVVTLLCDSGDRYRHTYYNDSWLQHAGLACQRERAALAVALDTGQLASELSAGWHLAGELAID
ncbi:MAG TPA: PLP-dependent cysteine synthase family protein [Candidatus Accumulibacter phosphatis]|nr:MAG: putative siderophore biosynthesis protein SbnA [Candidatus Accumulibacter sp. SK-11]HAY27960.1 PLP-dependent cysteine synthase family protein [Accumulibacter sp.]HCV13884.1 PLP-dependent cysteine synthase family protein [Accumulibacter sp.]HRL78049.1 PLP-dependent cysteine synthase family protein [Candidatus Accumulibacter phosphatis]HRQ94227.1 PLP-dependent cysteine synthase family protein [Candidatus Accumulibacter phosphatis]